MTTFALRVFDGATLAAAVLLLALPAHAQRANDEPRPSPNAAVSQTIGTTIVDMHYSRPGVRGRTIYGDLVPWDTTWRAGANEPTTITFSDDVTVDGQPLEAGTYNIFIRPNMDENWDVIVTPPMESVDMFDQATPVLTVSAEPADVPNQEWLQYRFENLTETSADLVMHWAERAVPITIATAD